MPRSTARPRLPQASDPIHSSIDAIAVVSMVIHRPLQAETIAFLLDDSGHSDTITIISGTSEPDSVLAVAECMARAGSTSPALCGLVVASVRPGNGTGTDGNVAGRHRPLAADRCNHRLARHRIDRVVRRRSRRVSTAHETCSATRIAGERFAAGAAIARRAVPLGLSRSPPSRRRRSSSRLGVITAPALIMSSTNSSGTS